MSVFPLTFDPQPISTSGGATFRPSHGRPLGPQSSPPTGAPRGPPALTGERKSSLFVNGSFDKLKERSGIFPFGSGPVWSGLVQFSSVQRSSSGLQTGNTVEVEAVGSERAGQARVIDWFLGW